MATYLLLLRLQENASTPRQGYLSFWHQLHLLTSGAQIQIWKTSNKENWKLSNLKIFQATLIYRISLISRLNFTNIQTCFETLKSLRVLLQNPLGLGDSFSTHSFQSLAPGQQQNQFPTLFKTLPHKVYFHSNHSWHLCGVWLICVFLQKQKQFTSLLTNCGRSPFRADIGGTKGATLGCNNSILQAKKARLWVLHQGGVLCQGGPGSPLHLSYPVPHTGADLLTSPDMSCWLAAGVAVSSTLFMWLLTISKALVRQAMNFVR